MDQAKSLKIDLSIVYRAMKRFEEGGEEGLEGRSVGRPKGVRKVEVPILMPHLL